ncbi:MAG: hypothetical protein CBC57_01795 [Euryarchaeota archaeon TMED97]|jgi:hypothetical protein|nr:MAG: hypothetical protein CBC57_01795 [Euryarchaeota archaeon TMED97]|tara:strand:- start:7122 stop:7304 length:183 start_codon:yes stop_codon:yes gene_type:complete
MPTVKDALAGLNAHERECAIRYQYIEKSLDEGRAKFKRLEMLLWGIYPFIVSSIILTKFL